MDLEPELKTCSICGGWMELGYLAPLGELAVAWMGPKTGIFRRKSAKVHAYRCPDCGLVQLVSEPDEK